MARYLADLRVPVDPEQVGDGGLPRGHGCGGELMPAGAAQGGQESGHGRRSQRLAVLPMQLVACMHGDGTIYLCQ